MAVRNYLSIGEVLVSLKAEFPDITISKIRFLEGEGLIEPKRTSSGYRKFFDGDVDRLRMILKMQRDEYLPLKVIRERLDAGDEASRNGGRGRPAASDSTGGEIAEAPTGLQMSLEEMSAATDVEPERIRELESFGLVTAKGEGDARYYDGDDLVLLRIVRQLFQYGIEPRHLTMYRHFTERESAFFEAIAMPLMRQRNPEARRQAAETVTELARLSRNLKSAMLQKSLRPYLTAS